MRFILKHIMNTKFYEWFMLSVVWRFRFTNYYVKFPGWKYLYMYSLLRPGDIIVAKDPYKLTSFLIKGEWDHAAFFIGKSPDEEYEVAEMVHTGFRKSMFFDICKEAEVVGIYRFTDDLTYIGQMVRRCKSFSKALYDVLFEFEENEDGDENIKALYCSELVYILDNEERMQVSLADIAGLGQKYISPDGLTKGKEVKLIARSDQIFKPET